MPRLVMGEKGGLANQKTERLVAAPIGACDWSGTHRIMNRALIGPSKDSVAEELWESSQ